MMTGSSSGWLMLAGMMARPRAISSRTNSGVTNSGMAAPKSSPSARRSAAPSSALCAAEVLAVRDVDHFFRDDAGAGEFELRDQLARLAAEDWMLGRAGRDEAVAGRAAIVDVLHRAGGDALEAALGDPVGAQRRQAGFQVDGDGGIGVGAGGVIGAIGFLARGRFQRDLAERHVDVGAAGGRGVDLAGAGDRAGGDAARAGGGLRLDGHGRLLNRARGLLRERTGERLRRHPSLRRHDPVQVQGSPRRRVASGSGGISAPFGGAPLGSATGWGGRGLVSNG